MVGINEAPNDIENPYDPLLEELCNLLPLSPLRCIYRVPERLRQGNEKAYTPQVVSIGPLHHGKEHLKAMEEHKKRYLRHFLSRTEVSFFDYIQMIKEQEGRLRGFYAESIEFSSDQFVRIVLVDAAFVIEFLLRNYSINFRDEDDYIFNKPMMNYSINFRDEDDYIFNKPMMKRDVHPDLRLLENQLPFFILQVLFNTTFSSANQQPSLLEISYFYIKGVIYSKVKEDNFDKICSSGVEVQHFVDLIRILYQPLKSKTVLKFKTTAAPNITELLQAGVKLKVGAGSSLFDIKFSSGILEIPKITITDTTNLTVRNLLAFEQCHIKEANYLTNYVFLMKRLVKTPKDVELLVEDGIIENWLGDTKKISTLLHDLGTRVIVSNHYYAALCEDLNNYCRTPRHKWMANLRQNYFSSPWSIISVVAAVILLILTFIQTVCSIKSIA